MQVKNLIVSPVTSCSINTNVGEVRDLMTVKKFSALPVVELKDKKVTLKGIVSFHDLAGVYNDDINVQQVMSTGVTVVTPEASVQEAAQIMIGKRIHHLVVVDEGEIVGIISSLDFVKLVAEAKI